MGKWTAELLLLDTCLNFVNDCAHMFRRNIVFHLLEADKARRGKQAVAIIGLVDVGDTIVLSMAQAFCRS